MFNSVGMFLESNALYYTIKRAFGGEYKLDYEKLALAVAKCYDFEHYTEQRVYTPTVHTPNSASFLRYLADAGYEVVTKSQKEIVTSGVKIKRCDFKLEMAVDAIDFWNQFEDQTDNLIVLAVNSPDFLPLIKFLKQDDTEVVIAGIESDIPKCLRRVCDVFPIDNDLVIRNGVKALSTT